MRRLLIAAIATSLVAFAPTGSRRRRTASTSRSTVDTDGGITFTIPSGTHEVDIT